MKSVILLSVLFVTKAAALVSFGACPQIDGAMSYSNYLASYVQSYGYYHKVYYADQSLEDLMGAAHSLFNSIPESFNGQDLYDSARYYSTINDWDRLFSQPSDSFVLKLLSFEPITKSEALYYCIDFSRGLGLMNTLRNLGILIPQVAVELVSNVLMLVNAMNILNIQVKYEAVIVTTDYCPDFNGATEAWLDSQIAKVPGYASNNLYSYKSACV